MTCDNISKVPYMSVRLYPSSVYYSHLVSEFTLPCNFRDCSLRFLSEDIYRYFLLWCLGWKNPGTENDGSYPGTQNQQGWIGLLNWGSSDSTVQNFKYYAPQPESMNSLWTPLYLPSVAVWGLFSHPTWTRWSNSLVTEITWERRMKGEGKSLSDSSFSHYYNPSYFNCLQLHDKLPKNLMMRTVIYYALGFWEDSVQLRCSCLLLFISPIQWWLGPHLLRD